MIQESQGLVFDRTREELTATDAAVVRFRRTVMAAAEALARDGAEPTASWQHEHYRVRPGSWIASNNLDFDEVMLERFGDPLGRVNSVE